MFELWSWLIVGGGLFLCQAAHGHPFHTSAAEMEFNTQTGCYEVTLKLYALDLEKALAQFEAGAPKELISSAPHSADGGLTEKPSNTLRVSPPINPPRNSDFEKAIAIYLETHFYLQNKSQTTADLSNKLKANGGEPNEANALRHKRTHAAIKSKLRLVGVESELSSVWVYFELHPHTTTDDLVLTNTIFFEINPEQINTCVTRTGARKTAIKTDQKQPHAPFAP